MASSRREFVQQSAFALSGVWLASHLPLLEALGAEARTALANAEPFKVFTPVEGRTMAALAAQIIPTDNTPGATEAGAVYFIDKALTGFAAALVPEFRAGLKAFDDAAKKEKRGVRSFADLSSAQQIKIMRQNERTEFFDTVRAFTIFGTLGDPMYGGGRNNAASLIMNMEHKPAYQPPFGYYDAQIMTSTKARSE